MCCSISLTLPADPCFISLFKISVGQPSGSKKLDNTWGLTNEQRTSPGLIRGTFGLRFSEKVQSPVLFGLYSDHKGDMT